MRIFAEKALVGKELEQKSNVILEVEKDRIKSISYGAPTNCDVVYDSSVTLMPGLIDSHAHLALDARIPGHLDMMNDAESIQTLRALRSCMDDLNAGVTGLRSLGDRYYIDVLLRDLIQKGAWQGPWIQCAGIGMKGLHGHGYVGKGFSGVEEFRRQCRENIFHHTDWLKMFITAGAPPATLDGHVNCFLSREEVRTVVNEAKACGLKTSCHCIGGQGLRYCTEEGVDVLDHCYWATDEDIDLILKHGTTVCFTPGVFMDEERLPLCPKGHADSVHKWREEVKKRLSKLVAAGPKFVIGSDAYHGLLFHDIEFMVELGMPRAEALKGVTVYGGELAGNMTGSIQEGYKADLITVKGNPLTEANACADVTSVMKDGIQIR